MPCEDWLTLLEQLGFFAKFVLEPGWHFYGAPLPPEYTATTISFEDTDISRQSFRFPEGRKVPIPQLGETLPVYSGEFGGSGALLLKDPLPEGIMVLCGGAVSTICGVLAGGAFIAGEAACLVGCAAAGLPILEVGAIPCELLCAAMVAGFAAAGLAGCITDGGRVCDRLYGRQ